MPTRRIILTALMLAAAVPAATRASQPLPSVEVYKSASCGCCNKWVEHLETNGFKVTARNVDDPVEYKRRFGVPPEMGSCHTAQVGGYFIEGHVPAREIKRLLNERPQALGLAVPGMPMGSPGMEGPRKDAYDVMLIRNDGSSGRYASY